MAIKNAIFFAATAQDVGKTTTCLGAMSALKQHFSTVGFLKPVGQHHVEVEEGLAVDKDVVLFREQFVLQIPYPIMSPVIIPAGFTRRYLDGQVDSGSLRRRVREAFDRLMEISDYTIVEGTGHAGVGSIIGLSNADVAALLGLDVVLITTGGLGAAFDQLALNLALFRAAGVKVRAIILNKVLTNKRQMVLEYMPKALKPWGIPLAGCIPYCDLLDAPSMQDYEQLFSVPLLSGEQHRYRHFHHERLVATTVAHFRKATVPQELIITHATREDIIGAMIEDEMAARQRHAAGDLERGLLLIGHQAPSVASVELLKQAELPALYAPVSSYRAMQMITRFTSKIRREDTCKVEKAITLVEEELDLNRLCQEFCHG
jgi:phosphate acetyltransferase